MRVPEVKVNRLPDDWGFLKSLDKPVRVYLRPIRDEKAFYKQKMQWISVRRLKKEWGISLPFDAPIIIVKPIGNKGIIEVRVSVIHDTNAPLAALRFLLYSGRTEQDETRLNRRDHGQDISHMPVRQNQQRRR